MTKRKVTINSNEFTVDYISVQELLDKVENVTETLINQGCKRDEILTETENCSRGYMYLYSDRMETDKEYQDRLLKETAMQAMYELQKYEKLKRNIVKLEAEVVALQERIAKAKGQ